MEAPFHIVGCVLSARPAPDLIDAFVAHARRERAVVMVKSAQGATFVRFNAPDTRLVMQACQAARGDAASLLRFGFAMGQREAATGGADGLNISTRSIVQANDLAAGASDGEVLVSPQLAVLLIESGLGLRGRQVHLPGGRDVAACSLDLQPADAAAASRGARSGSEPTVSAALDPAPGAGAGAPGQAVAMGGVFSTLLAQAEEMARRQSELEARQDAVLGKMTLADEGQPSAAHLAELETELEAQLSRVHERLDFIDKLEQRVSQMQRVTTDVERRLGVQVQRRAEVETLKVLCDALVEQMADAHHKLDGVAALQQRLLPLTSQVATLAQTLESSQRLIAALEGRLGEVDRRALAVEQKMHALAEHEALVRAVRAEVDHIREISGRSRADLQFLSDRHGDIDSLRGKVEGLIGSAADTDEKIALIESRRKMVDEVQSRASTITHMLGDIQLNLEMLNEQRSVIDHVGEKLARLDFTVQEAQNTLRALQREREVAERVEQGLKALRARTAAYQAI